MIRINNSSYRERRFTMAKKQGKQAQSAAPKKKKTEPRVILVRVVALAIAALMFGSVLLAALQ